MSQRACRSGFTLIEILAALAITGVMALIAHRLVSVTIDSARLVNTARTAQDRRENALRWLRLAFLSLETGDSGGGFAGYPDHVAFGTWLEQPGGWSAREQVTLRLVGSRATVMHSGGEELVLADSLSHLAFDYLLEPGAKTHWVGVWLSPLSAPLAVRMRWSWISDGRARADTVLLLIKERG